ncbi:MAG: hypothetical protein N3A54_01100 [Patescibacteria group bacterium]|nr:hypothetical protein [Patescibacteria group bacterium]
MKIKNQKPVKVRTKKELEPIIQRFMNESSDLLKQQFQTKKTFHEKVKFLRYMGYVE